MFKDALSLLCVLALGQICFVCDNRVRRMFCGVPCDFVFIYSLSVNIYCTLRKDIKFHVSEYFTF